MENIVSGDSCRKGMMACTKVQMRALELREAGQNVFVSVPTNPECRYDMVVDRCGKLYRAQVKYAGGSRADVSGVAIVSLTKGKRGERRYTSDEIDVLLVYVPVVDKLCWFGPEVYHDRTQIHIRYAPTRSGRMHGCVMFEDYVW